MVPNTPTFENQEYTAPTDVGSIRWYQRIGRHITLNWRLTAQQCTLIFSVKDLVIHNYRYQTNCEACPPLLKWVRQ